MPPVATPAVANETALTTPPDRRASARRASSARPGPAATDDEILGLEPSSSPSADAERAGLSPAPTADDHLVGPEAGDFINTADAASPESVRAALEANPDLRRAWDDARAYREAFVTPDAARAATARLTDLDRMDALFFSRRPEDHAELARAVAALDPAAFASLAQAMQGLVGAQHARPDADPQRVQSNQPKPSTQDGSVGEGLRPARAPEDLAEAPGASSPASTHAQSNFFQATNAVAVQSVLDAIETQVERLLPENISKSARNRVVGEIYRELDTTLGSNHQLAQQMREAFRSGRLDAEHQHAVVTLITGRARQALPGVAKRVLNEWTSTVMAAHNDRRARQQAAERRVDIAGSSSSSDGPRSMTPREIDYRRMSDADILNL